MAKLNIDTAEELALKMRYELRLGTSEPINMKTTPQRTTYIYKYIPNLMPGIYNATNKKSRVKYISLLDYK